MMKVILIHIPVECRVVDPCVYRHVYVNRYPSFHWKAPHKHVKVLSFGNGNILQTGIYKLNDEEKVPIIKYC